MNGFFISLSIEDVSTILNNQQPNLDGASDLYAICNDAMDEIDNGCPTPQFRLENVSADLINWCKNLINDDKDESGILDYIIESWTDSTTIKSKIGNAIY